MKKLEYTPFILSLLKQGKKLQAVKFAKELYGLSLVDAKNMIDSYHPGGDNFYVMDEPDITSSISQNKDEGKSTTVKESITEETPKPVVISEDMLPYCCPNCGSSQVEKSLGGKLEHAAAWATTKAVKSYVMGDYGSYTGGAENEIIKEEVPFQQVCNYCHRTFHASKSQIEAGKYAMSKAKSSQLTEAYNRRLQSVKNGEVRRIKEAASKKLPRIGYAGSAFLLGLLITATCEHETTGPLGLPSYTWSFMFSCVLMFFGFIGLLIEGMGYFGKISEANEIDKMPIKQYAKNHKA